MGGDAKEVFIERGEIVGFFHRHKRCFVCLDTVVIELLLGGEHGDVIDESSYGRWRCGWLCATRFDSTVAGDHRACRRNHIDLKTFFVIAEQADFRKAVKGEPLQFLESRVLSINSKETHVHGCLPHYRNST